MKAVCAFALAFGLMPCPAHGERAKSPADATVFVRLTGSLHAEVEEAGVKQTANLDHVEIATGSGFVISPHGYVLTNDHVVYQREPLVFTRGLRNIKITVKVARIDVCFPRSAATAAGLSTQCSEASVTATNPAVDLTVLFVNLTDLPYVALGDSDAVSAGLAVEALGYPFGREVEVGKVASAPDLIPEISTTRGAIAALRENDAGERRYLQISSSVNPGNSGGPVLDRDGFAVGVIRMRLAKSAEVGFAIPVNDVKDFLDAHGLSHLMPVRRLRLGPFQSLEPKRIGLRLAEGFIDGSPFRAHVDADSPLDGIELRIDRVLSPWTLEQIEQTLVGTQAFEPGSMSIQPTPEAKRSPEAPLILGRAAGFAADDKADIRMQYAVLDLGAEKLVARYIGPVEQMAFNESVLRDSLASLEGARTLAAEPVPTEGVEWAASTAAVDGLVPLPAGWVVEPGGPAACSGLPEAGSSGSAFPAHDFTLVLRTAVWSASDIVPEGAASACSARRGSLGAASYVTLGQWLGVSYVTEGVFLRLGREVVQLEVLSPDQSASGARALLAAWFKKLSP